jgi:CheY-like chemotaxis protein
VHQAVETIRPLAADSKHEVTVTLPPEPIYLHADPIRLAQVFSNLLNNSCKYTEPGGRIWLTAERQGSDVVVSVKDTGVGIPRDKLNSIFELFTQVDRSLDRLHEGLGIGLSLVKRLVGLHDGTVEALSDGPGLGSEFVVRLPIIIEKRGEQQPLTTIPQATAKRRILIVDDNKDSAQSLATLLKITGHETHTAYDGVEAIEAAERIRPDLVLLDIGLPKMNGFDACRRMREQPWGKSLVLMALTGWGQDEDRRKAREAGFDQLMVKPVEYTALVKILAELRPTSNASESPQRGQS